MFGGGDSAGGNMTEAIAARRHDLGYESIAGQILLYPESRVSFDTPAATEHNSSSYGLCGIIVMALVLYTSPMIRRTVLFFPWPRVCTAQCRLGYLDPMPFGLPLAKPYHC